MARRSCSCTARRVSRRSIPMCALLSARHRLIAPSHPGFGNSSLPDWIDAPDDIAYIHLELLDRLGLDQVDVIGCSLGGWIACELATKIAEARAPAGAGGAGRREDRPGRSPRHSRTSSRCRRARWRRCCSTIRTRMRMDPVAPHRRATGDLGAQPRDARAAGLGTVHAQSQAAAPAASRHRADLVRPRCQRRAGLGARISTRYARLLPNARIATIAAAGHAPHVEQPDAFARTVLAFLEAGARAMKAWHFSENAYPYLPPADEYESIRVSLPNRIYDPREGRRALRPLPRRMADRRGRGHGDHAQRAPPDRDLRRSRGAAGARRAGAAHQARRGC